MSQLRELATPIPPKYMGHNDKGMDAADHTVINQLLLRTVGPYSGHVVEVLRSDVPEFKTKGGKVYPGGHFVTGVVYRISCTIDGVPVEMEEAGGCENAALKDGDGERLKHAISDALKRCAMREGLGLHIWAQDMYFLDRQLDKDAQSGDATVHPINRELDASVARHPASLAKTGQAVDEETGEIVDVVEPSQLGDMPPPGPTHHAVGDDDEEAHKRRMAALHASLHEAWAIPKDFPNRRETEAAAKDALLAQYKVESASDLDPAAVSRIIDACKQNPAKVREACGLPAQWGAYTGDDAA